MTWAYLAACGMMFFMFTTVILMQTLRGSQQKVNSLLKLNASLNDQLNTQVSCLSTAGKEITRLEQMVGRGSDGITLPILHTVLQNGLTASLSHEGSTFQIKLDLKAHYYNEVDMAQMNLPPCPQVFLFKDIQRLVDKWAVEVKPQVCNEMYQQLCTALRLVPIEPVFLPTAESPNTAAKEGTRVA